jgi:hypothetical protein
MVSDRRALGGRLKRQRERAGVTLERISQSTKVPVALFAGLESGDCSRWPAGLFARAYVRSYAEAIGLNADETVEEFAAAFGAAVKSDPFETAPASSAGAAGTLRLSLVEESPLDLPTVARRAGLAACELLLGALIAAVAHVGFGTRTWVTVGLVLAYFTLGRLIGDDPLLFGIFRRLRHRPDAAAAPAEAASPEVSAVGDAASTAA